MKYFKVIKGDQFIGVATSYDLRRFQKKHRIILIADMDNAEYLQVNEDLYRDSWFKPVITDAVPYTECTITTIEKAEYDKLYKAVDAGDIIEVKEQPVPETTTTTQEENTTAERTVEASPVDRIKALEENQKLIQKAIDDLILTSINEEGS